MPRTGKRTSFSEFRSKDGAKSALSLHCTQGAMRAAALRVRGVWTDTPLVCVVVVLWLCPGCPWWLGWRSAVFSLSVPDHVRGEACVALHVRRCCACALRAWLVQPSSCVQRPRVRWSDCAFAERCCVPRSCRPSSPPTPTTSSSAASSPFRARTPTASPGKLRLWSTSLSLA